MTTICYFDKDGNLINIGDWDFQPSTNDAGETVIENPLPVGAYSEDREVFQDADGGRFLAKDPLDLVEAHIDKFFSTARLLQMKVWWDTFDHALTPKLEATYQWTDSVTRAAIAGSTEFANPPHSFQEIAAEFLSLGE